MEGKVEKKMEQRRQFKPLAPVHHVTISVARSMSSKLLIGWSFLQLSYKSHRLWAKFLLVLLFVPQNLWAVQKKCTFTPSMEQQRDRSRGSISVLVSRSSCQTGGYKEKPREISHTFWLILLVFILTEISCSPSHLCSICRIDVSIWAGYY